MDDQHKLEWVARNRQKRHREQSISDVTQGMIERLRVEGFDPAMQAADALATCVDNLFREHCRVASFKNHELLIHVNEVAMVSMMQRNWATRISDHMRACLGRGQVQKIVFQFGQDGVYIPPAL